MNSRSPTKSGVISSPDPREQDVIQGQSGSPVRGKDMDFVSGFDKKPPGNYSGYVSGQARKNSENANMSFEESSVTNSVGEEDYIGDTDGSMDESNRRGVINGNSYSNQKKPAASKKKNIPN